ncbi:MAG: hypothetical protein PHV74_10300 [Dehalococcoidia bacterium]|nr:hypothetical protein [Dehalococcoidia bacterium]
MSRGRDLLSRLHCGTEDDDKPGFRIVKGIRSFEGLLGELEGQDKVRLITLGELLSLMAKSRQDGTGNLISQLTELFDCPDMVNPPVLKNTIIATRPFVSILAGTTQSWLAKALTAADIMGGFGNRWLYFSGNAKEPNPNPAKVDAGRRDILVSKIDASRQWAITELPDGELIISNGAGILFDQYYRPYYHRCQTDGLLPTLIVRLQDFLWKLAVLYAVMDHSKVIREEHISPAIKVAGYLEASVMEVFSNFNQSVDKEKEMRLLEYLRQAGKPVPKRDIYRGLTLSAKELDVIAMSLLKLGLIRSGHLKKSPKGKKAIETYAAVFDGPTDSSDTLTH